MLDQETIDEFVSNMENNIKAYKQILNKNTREVEYLAELARFKRMTALAVSVSDDLKKLGRVAP